MKMRPGTLYVCPKSGVIKRTRKQPARQPRVKEQKELERNGKRYEKLEGIWYEVQLAVTKKSELLCVMVKPHGKPNHPGTMTKPYPNWYPKYKPPIVHSRQLSSRELKKLGLKNK
jgi:hypothetical protein